MRRAALLVLSIATGITMLVLASGASAKAVGGCPPKWELVTVESLGLTPEEANGIPSLDGNRDGLTCIKPLLAVPEPSPIFEGFVFRDNTVK